tara:strand:+ start:2219 stop:2383 length:165 start_codon:yes stop_codon:yes gene_type:complete
MSPFEWIGWFIFILIISLLFFAAFGSSRYGDGTIEDYMEQLIVEEQAGNRNGPR